jgi:hypothetical protein
MEAQIIQFPAPPHVDSETIDAQIKHLEELLRLHRERTMMETKANMFGMLDLDVED